MLQTTRNINILSIFLSTLTLVLCLWVYQTPMYVDEEPLLDKAKDILGHTTYTYTVVRENDQYKITMREQWNLGF